MFKKIFVGFVIIIAALAAALAVGISMQPAEFRVERTGTINTSPAEVFPHVNDFRKWEAWSPWAKLDPDAINTIAGPSQGAGATFTWSGNDKIGEGMMTLLESRPNEYIKIKLEFKRPFEDTAITEFFFKGEGNQTVVTWKMVGENSLMGKAMCLFIDMDKMVGASFDEGLANLKGVAEVGSKK